MNNNEKSPKRGRQHALLLVVAAILALTAFGLVGCDQSAEEPEAVEPSDSVDYAPFPGKDWEVSMPAEQDLDPQLVAELYESAADLERLYGLLVVKNGHLVAEKYFNEGSVGQKARIQSATKSIASALVGIALDQGCLTSVEQKMLDSFPEVAGQITDPRKEQITLRQMLQMRPGYPWEESHPDLWEGLLTRGFRSHMVHYPLVTDPGTKFHCSNASSDWLGMIAARACDVDHREFAKEHLFAPIGGIRPEAAAMMAQ